MKLTGEEARNIVFADTDEWEKIQSEIVQNTRWSIIHTGVFKHIESGKYYRFNWSEGATEIQDELPYEYEDEVEVHEVLPKEKTIIEYV